MTKKMTDREINYWMSLGWENGTDLDGFLRVPKDAAPFEWYVLGFESAFLASKAREENDR